MLSWITSIPYLSRGLKLLTYGECQEILSYRRRVEYGLMEEPSHTLTDDDLDEILRQLRVELPELGETMAAGRLRSLGYRVPRQQLREGLRRIDPLSAALRWSTKTSRRPYTVSGPNCLWHIGKLRQCTDSI